MVLHRLCQTLKGRLHGAASRFWSVVFWINYFQTNFHLSLFLSGISLLSWPFWLCWGCWMAWFSCRSSCPWWALQLKSPQLTMPVACPRLLLNLLFPRPWPIMGTTQATTTPSQLDSKRFLNHQTPSIILRWPPHRGSEKKILNTATGVRTLCHMATFHLRLTYCWRPARTPASPSSRYAAWSSRNVLVFVWFMCFSKK